MSSGEGQRGGEAVDAAIERACRAGDLDDATQLALRHYGPEVLGFMVARVGPGAAQDPFQEFSIKLWRNWQRFRFDCSVRTWIYRLARGVLIDHLRSPERRAERNVALSQTDLSGLVEQVRSTTLAHLRSSVKSRARLLREELTADERELLTLRVDRGMAYRDIALVLGLVAPDAPPEEQRRLEARVRQRFHTARRRLAELARRQGLAADSGDEE